MDFITVMGNGLSKRGTDILAEKGETGGWGRTGERQEWQQGAH